MLELYIEAVTDRGCVRHRNEDRVLVGHELLRDGLRKIPGIKFGREAKYVAAIADGMGGHQAGEVAAELVLELLNEKVAALPSGCNAEELESEMKRWALEAHCRLLGEGERDPAKRGMGTTLVAVLFCGGAAYYLNAGDSSLYRFRDGLLAKISSDHSLTTISGERSRVLWNSFGAGKSILLEFGTVKCLDEDILLLCSDGLTDALAEEEIEAIFNENDGAVEELLAKAKRCGGDDNISIATVAVRIVPEGASARAEACAGPEETAPAEPGEGAEIPCKGGAVSWNAS